jgi:hypothetical protein
MKEYITNNTGSAQTLESTDDFKIPVYNTQAAIISDISNLDANEIVSNKENTPLTPAEGAQPAIAVINSYFNTSLNDSGWASVSGLSLQQCPIVVTGNIYWDWGNLSVSAYRKNNWVMLKGSIVLDPKGTFEGRYIGPGTIATNLPSKYRPIDDIYCSGIGYVTNPDPYNRYFEVAVGHIGVDSSGNILIRDFWGQHANSPVSKFNFNWYMCYKVN